MQDCLWCFMNFRPLLAEVCIAKIAEIFMLLLIIIINVWLKKWIRNPIHQPCCFKILFKKIYFLVFPHWHSNMNYELCSKLVECSSESWYTELMVIYTSEIQPFCDTDVLSRSFMLWTCFNTRKHSAGMFKKSIS